MNFGMIEVLAFERSDLGGGPRVKYRVISGRKGGETSMAIGP